MAPGRPRRSLISGLVARVRSLWRGVSRRGDVEADMVEEFRHHVELRTEDLIRRGVPAHEAARRAHVEFGHVESHRKAARASRGLRAFDQIGFSWLDVKLGVRMLAKYPGLSLVSVIGMSVAMAIGTGGFGLVHALVDADLPLDEGERIVALQNSDARTPGSVDPHALHDFVLWRAELGSIRDLSAVATAEGTITVEGAGPAVVPIARMTASGFRVARVAPLLGRPLLDEDEREGAPPVVVIAQEEWQRRFSGDPEILGRTVRLGTIEHTVVGVMPEGFRFPINHRYWTPLRLDPTAHEIGGGPAIMVFGRLADGVELERAQAELSTLGLRRSAASPDTHEHLRPRVLPYTHAFVGIDGPARGWLVRTVQVVLSLLLVVVAVNVAVLVYARTAARMGEIAVRSALGASRRRVVTQLFAEALVLSLVAALIGLTMVRVGFDRFLGLIGQENVLGLPFWVDFGFSPAIVAYVAGLVVLAGVIVGVIPALKATGSAIHSGLQQLRGGSRLRLGRAWNALIVTQVAIAVAVLPYALYVAGPSISRGIAEPDYPIGEFLRASLSVEGDGAPASPAGAVGDGDVLAARFLDSSTELLRRVEEDPAVAGVTFASRFPGSEEVTRIEVEGSGTRTSVWVNRVDIDLFTVFDVPILAGRNFTESDAGRESNAVVVDRVFADLVLGGGDVLGRRVRLALTSADGVTGEVGPWLEIVGVVPEFTVPPAFQPEAPKLYRPLALADAPDAVHLAVRARPDAVPAAFVGRLREIAESVDPALRVDELETASQAERERQQGLLFLAIVVVSVTGSVLLLSAAGIYAMMSFTVASRRREIGIRSALGAAPGRVLTGIFKRASAQLGAGVLGGLLLAEVVVRVSGGTFLGGEGVFLLPTVAVLMVSIGLLAALGPARRGLAVQPTEALREE